MKRIFLFVLTVSLLLLGCKSQERLLREGNYDAVVETAIRKLRRNPHNEKQIELLQKAYPLAVKKDLDRINYLKLEGQPKNWEEIYRLYVKIKERQEKVEALTPLYLNGRPVVFQHLDIEKDLLEAKRKAADYHYAMGDKLLKQCLKLHNKYDCRLAYDHFVRAKELNPAFLDIDKKINQCLEYGKTYVLIELVNNTMYKLPEDFKQEFVNYPLNRLNSMWIEYHNRDVRNGNYDIIETIVMEYADVTADKERELNYEETKTVEEQVNDTVTRTKIYKCKVREFQQLKIARINGTLRIYDVAKGQVVKSQPLTAEHRFENYYAVVSGSLKACSKRTREIMKNKPQPFPRNYDMILSAAEVFRNVAWNAILDNKRFIENNY